MRAPGINCAQYGWMAFCRGFGLCDQLTIDRLWKALERSRHAEAMALKFQCAATLLAPSRAHLHRRMLALIEGPCTPQRLLPLFESFARAGWITLSDLNQLSEMVLSITTRDGQWKGQHSVEWMLFKQAGTAALPQSPVTRERPDALITRKATP